MNILLDLFLTFAKIGLFTFGGGYAMISMIEYNCVERKQWITHDEMMNVTVIAESTPGPIAINCATFTGYKKAGFIGALAAPLGMIVPSFVVIYLISMFLDNFLELTIIANAFKGIKIAVGILILDAAITKYKDTDPYDLSDLSHDLAWKEARARIKDNPQKNLITIIDIARAGKANKEMIDYIREKQIVRNALS